MAKRTFIDTQATRGATSLLIGLIGASSSGKTMSALRLAKGIQSVTKGEIFGIDTESGRMLHYADEFKFRHVRFDPPHSPEDYLDVFEYCVSKGAGIVIFDSASHEWEGIGGVLDMHEAELDRMAGQDFKARDRLTFPAWAKPKAAHAKFKQRVVQSNVNCIFCFRAKRKTEMAKETDEKGRKKTTLVDIGWQAISDNDLVYEMTLRALLPPGSEGRPRWESDIPGEKEIFKIPKQFLHIFPRGKDVQFGEDVGEAMARWAAGPDLDVSIDALVDEYQACQEVGAFRVAQAHMREVWSTLSAASRRELSDVIASTKTRIGVATDAVATNSSIAT